jgi:eukaryotic-like serine/threonine-protein kinase
MSSDERAELRGVVLDGRYKIGACIGVGGTGVVFEATRVMDGASVVIKTMRPRFAENADLIRRMEREAEVYDRVVHPGIVPIYETGRLGDGSPYLVMKRMRSESLAQLIHRTGALSCGEVAVIGARLAAILHAVHLAGYVHRDIKPEHVLLDRAPQGKLEVRLLDFGVCASHDAPVEEKARERGRVYGTPNYVSPEQAAGEPNVDARADLFSLGITLFEARTGQLPFQGKTASELLRRILTTDAPSIRSVTSDVTPELTVLVESLLSRRVQDRIPSARALSRALAPLLRDRSTVEHAFAARLQIGNERRDDRTTLPRGIVAA